MSDFTQLFSELNVTTHVRNIPSLSTIPLDSHDDIQQLAQQSNLILPIDFLNFASTIGSGKLGRVHIYGLYRNASLHQFDIRSHTKRIQNAFERMMNPIESTETNNESNDDESEEEQTIHQPKFLKKHFDSIFGKLIIFARDAIEDTLYYAWKNGEKEILLVEFNEQDSDVKPPTVLCESMEEFIRDLCLGQKLDDEELHSAKYYENEQEDEEEETEEVPRVFIPSMTIKSTD